MNENISDTFRVDHLLFLELCHPHRYTIQQPIQQSIDIDAVYFKATPDVEKTIEYYQGADGRELAYVQYPERSAEPCVCLFARRGKSRGLVQCSC